MNPKTDDRRAVNGKDFLSDYEKEMILIDNLDIVMSDKDVVIDYMGHHPAIYLPLVYSYARVRDIWIIRGDFT